MAGRFKGHASWALPFLLAIQASGQIRERSPEGLIRFLTDPSRLTESERMGIVNCGIDGRAAENEEAVRQLVSKGDAAASKLELSLGWLATGEAEFVPNAWSVFSAYAQIKGPAAFPFLWTLYSNPNLYLLIDGSMARAFGLTSYISSSNDPELIIWCGPGPRIGNTLDQLIRSWERGNREWLESTLGPNALAALSAAIKDKTWTGVRSELWPVRAGELTAIGYRLNVPRQSPEPGFSPEYYASSEEPLDLKARFTTRSGSECGERKMTFAHVEKGLPPAYQTYLVDNADILDVLRLIGTCAAKP